MDSLLLHFCRLIINHHKNNYKIFRFKEEERSARVYRINFNQFHFLIFFLCCISGSPILAATTRIRRRRSLRPPPLLTDSEERTIRQLSSTPLLVEDDKPSKEVEESVKVLKDTAKTRKVAAEKVLSALSVIEKAKIDPSGFLETLGGNESPGRT
ncbi:hypothetical protein S83_051928 [Arachis hypogaea]